MDGDWAELDDAGDLGVGLLQIPDVELPEPPKQETPPSPKENAWTRPNQSQDVRRPSGGVRNIANPSTGRSHGKDNSHFSRGAHSKHGSGPSSKTLGRFLANDPSNNTSNGPMNGSTPAATRTPPHYSAHGDKSRESGSKAWFGSSEAHMIYVGNLPYDTKEQDVITFFADFNISEADIDLCRKPNKDQVYAAKVKFRNLNSAKEAIRLHGVHFGGRPAEVRLDSTDRHHSGVGAGGGFRGGATFLSDDLSHRHVTSPPGYDDNAARGHWDRKSSGNYGGFSSLSSRDGQANGPQLNLRNRKGLGAPSGHFDHAPFQGHGSSGHNRDRENGSHRERRGSVSHTADPSIPQGPTPEGRKKLTLKPRTKPLPKLEIDTRAIDLPSRPPSTPRSDSNSAQDDVMVDDPHGQNTGAVGIGKPECPSEAAVIRYPREVSLVETRGTVNFAKPSPPSLSNGSAREANGVLPRRKNEEEKEKPKTQNSFAALDVDGSDDSDE